MDSTSTIMASTSTKKIILKSCDGGIFVIDEAVAFESQTIKNMNKYAFVDETGITLPKVTSKILEKIIEYCKKHAAANSDEMLVVEDDLSTWDAEFVKVDQVTLFDLILAANYLDIKSLLDLTCKTVADMIKVKKPEEIRKTFDISRNFTKEEEEKIRRENQWAFE